MMKKKNRWITRISQLLILVAGIFMCSFVFAEDLIELEFGYEALEEYKTFQLDPERIYRSADESVITIDEYGLVTAEHFGNTEIYVLDGENIVETIEVIVYLVGDEPVPWGSVKVSKSYITGYPGQKFKPKNYITRAEVATMFSKILEIEQKETVLYIDLLESHWGYTFIQSMVSHGLMAARNEDEFFPDAYLTKREFTEIICNYANYQGFELNDDPIESILDVMFTDENFREIHKLVNARVFTLDENMFKPDDFIRRDEAVAIINGIIDQKGIGHINKTFIDVEITNMYYHEIHSAYYTN